MTTVLSFSCRCTRQDGCLATVKDFNPLLCFQGVGGDVRWMRAGRSSPQPPESHGEGGGGDMLCSAVRGNSKKRNGIKMQTIDGGDYCG